MRNSKMLIDIYDEIDSYMRIKLRVGKERSHVSLIKEMIDKKYIPFSYKEKLVNIADLRNTIIHNSFSNKKIDPIAEPHERIVELYEEICRKIIEPPKALESIAVRNISKAYPEDSVISVMKKMKENSYSNIPVMKNDTMVGVFSESTIFDFILDKEILLLDECNKIADFENYISFNSHNSEYFEFAPRNASIFEIHKRFQFGVRKNERLGAVFITENGKETEGLLGMVTPWDLLEIEEI